MKKKVYRFDSSFDKPGQFNYTATLTTSNLEGMKALKNVTLQNFRGTSIKLGGYNAMGAAKRTKATEVLRILVGTRFDKVEYRGGTKEFHLYFKKNKNEVLGMYIDRIMCVTTKLLPKIENLPAYDDSETGRAQGYVTYSETVPNWGHRIGYKLPFSMAAYQERINRESESDKTVADTKSHVAAELTRVAEETVKQEEIDTRVQEENLKQTKAKLSRWAIIGAVAAAIAIIVAVIVIVARKK